MLGLPQVFTGPLVNMMLILTALLLDPLAGITLGAITPLVALFRGQLPPVLLALVPFIAIGNAVLVLVFSLLGKMDHGDKSLFVRVNFWAGIIFGSAAKFCWLATSVHFILPVILGMDIPDIVVVMMTFPQLFTALIGSVLALAIYELIKTRRS